MKKAGYIGFLVCAFGSATASVAMSVKPVRLTVQPLFARPYYDSELGLKMNIMTPAYNQWGSALSMQQIPLLAAHLQAQTPRVPLQGITLGKQLIILPKAMKHIKPGAQVALTSDDPQANPRVLALDKGLVGELKKAIDDGDHVSAYNILAAKFDFAREHGGSAMQEVPAAPAQTEFDHPENVESAVRKIPSMFQGFWGSGYELDAKTGKKYRTYDLNGGVERSPSGDRILIRRSYWPDNGDGRKSDAFSEEYITIIAGPSPALFITRSRSEAPFEAGEERYKRAGLIKNAAIALTTNRLTLRFKRNKEETVYSFEKQADGTFQRTETGPNHTVVMNFDS